MSDKPPIVAAHPEAGTRVREREAPKAPKRPVAGTNLGLRLFFLLVTLLLPAFLFYAVSTFRSFEALQAEQVEDVLRLSGLRVSDRLASYPPLADLEDVPREQLSRELKRMVEEVPALDSIAVFYSDSEGVLKFLAGHPATAQRPTQEDAEVQARGNGLRIDVLRGDRVLRLASMPIQSEGSVNGVIRLAIQPEKIGLGPRVPQLRLRLLLAALALFALAAVGVLFFFRFAVGRPIQRLIDAMDRATGGDLNALVDLHAAEFGLLAGSYNQMMRRLKSSMDENRSLIEQIRRFNEELQGKVKAATSEVAGKNVQLEAANERLILLQRQLTTLEKLATLGQIAALIAHELGTPLNAISGHLQLLLQEQVSDPSVQERLKVIDGQVDRLTGIVRDVLKVMRVPPPRFERIDVKRVIQNVVELFGPLAEKRRVFLHLRLEESLPQISADADQLQQVFLNLVSNAMDAMKGGGTLTISTSFVPEIEAARLLQDTVATLQPGNCVRIDVADTGTGMDEEAAKHAFEPFYTTKRAEAEGGASTGMGLGLGLSICRQILKNHKGEIAVRSETGKGTTFSIYVPVDPR